MPLNEREQRILEEIERQFYQDDPKLAQTVARTTLGAVNRRRQRIAAIGFLLGLVVMLAFFTRTTWIALAGFIVMLAAAGWIATSLRSSGDDGTAGRLHSMADRLRQRWGRER